MLNLSFLDKALIHFDSLLRAKASNIEVQRANPADAVKSQVDLPQEERKQSVAMMRINHTGEVCAQALYQGQALTARSPKQYTALLTAAQEETDHLHWCKQRLQELNGRPSLLNPVWYAGSLAIGALAGCAGDKISLGFLAETEHQVTAHIDKHLRKISYRDLKSRAILEQMRIDELKHATTAESAGAKSLPTPVKIIMRFTAKIMTITTAKI